MSDSFVYLAALGLGFFGGSHCIGMCGGIMAALSFAVPDLSQTKRIVILLGYNIGRISSYGIMGALVGGFGSWFAIGPGNTILRVIAGVLLVCMGLYLANWWRGLVYLEKGGQYLWRYVQPFAKDLMPVSTLPKAMLLGGLWGWLPCGLVYSALAYATTAATPVDSALVMVAFGAGTLPALLASGLFAERLKAILQKKEIRAFFALSIIAFGVWTIWGALGHGAHSVHHH